MTTTRRCLAVSLLWLGFAAWAAMPAAAQVAQVDGRYTGPGLAVPALNASGGNSGGSPGGVLAATGQRTGSESVPTQVLASQVSGAVGGTAQAPVQGLAFTGADIVTLVTFGLVAIMLGVVLNRRARTRPLADH